MSAEGAEATGGEGATEPTHRIHWRISCDAEWVGHGQRIHRTHEARVKQAGYLYKSLIPERCRFGPRRLVLEGEADYVPSRWHDPAPTRFGYALAVDTAKWTLKTLYGMPPGPSRDPLGLEPRNARVEVRVAEIKAAHDGGDPSMSAEQCRCQIVGWSRDPYEPHIPSQPEWEQADNCPVHPLDTPEASQ